MTVKQFLIYYLIYLFIFPFFVDFLKDIHVFFLALICAGGGIISCMMLFEVFERQENDFNTKITEVFK